MKRMLMILLISAVVLAFVFAGGAKESAGARTYKVGVLREYVIASLMYALAGYLLAAKSGGASASMGMGYELEAIAGCTIGGVSTTGGIGTVPGVLVGVLVFELLKIVLKSDIHPSLLSLSVFIRIHPSLLCFPSIDRYDRQARTGLIFC